MKCLVYPSCTCVFQPLFTMSVQQQSIKPFTAAEYEQLTKTFGDNAVRTAIFICIECSSPLGTGASLNVDH